MADLDALIADCYRKYNEPFATQEAAPLRRDKVSMQSKREERETELKPKIEVAWRKQVREEMESQIAIGEEKKKSFERRRESLHKELAELEVKAKAAGTGLRPPQIVATEEKIELAKKSLEWTAQKISEVELEVPGSRIIPLQPAAVPLEKDRTRQTKIAGAGGSGGLLLRTVRHRLPRISLAQDRRSGRPARAGAESPRHGPRAAGALARSPTRRQSRNGRPGSTNRSMRSAP